VISFALSMIGRGTSTRLVRRYPNAVLVDWYSASVEHPEYFVEDGIHLRIEGQRVYAGLIAEALDAD
jgi:hypothetical protein